MDERLPAGKFSTWLGEMQRALAGDGGSDVPCGGCTACCRSAQFVHVGPEETETLARIPAELLFPAPRLPAGNVLLGYDQNGHCPMLIDDACSIYDHRPRTCRTYDCRVFPAAGVGTDEEDAAPVARRARRWQFDYPDEADEVRHEAVRAAGRYVREHGDLLSEGAAPVTESQRAVLAVQLHGAFLQRDGAAGRVVVVEPAPEAVRVVLASRRSSRGSAG